MDALSRLKDLVSHPLSAWPTMQERGTYVLELVKAHPLMSLGVAAGSALVWNYVRTPKNLPPGPWGWIGVISWSTVNLPAQILELRKRYGDVISFYKHGQLMVILNSESTIRKAFIDQADHFSHMNVEMFNILGIDDEIFAAPFNDTWKTNRRFAALSLKNSGFGAAKSEGKIHELLTMTIQELEKAADTSVDVFSKIKLISAATMSWIVLGGPGSMLDPDTMELLHLTDQWYSYFNEAFIAANPFSLRNKFLPAALSYMIAARSFPNFKKVHREFTNSLTKKIHQVASNTPRGELECVTNAYLRERGNSSKAVETFVKTILIFFPDAIDTACIITSWCLLYITYYPEVQKRLYKEVKSTIGTKLPTFTDRVKMPFTQAVVSETLRLTHITPLSTIRVLKSQIKIKGYTLPKGANVSANYHGIHFDPEIFPGPSEFKPSRFMEEDGSFNSALAARLVPFSIGNRKCLGEGYFRLYIFLVVTRLLQQFEMCFDPAAPTPSLEPDSNFFFPKPQPYKVCFKSREKDL